MVNSYNIVNKRLNWLRKGIGKMSLLKPAVLEKVKPALTSLIQIFFGDGKSNKRHHEEESEFFSDKFVKTGTNDLNSTPLTRKVWVNGKSFTIIGFSQQELDTKVEKIHQKQGKIKATTDINPQLFHNLYTEQQEVQENEWALKRDVWVNEYFPA
jgi:hypothetical protein